MWISNIEAAEILTSDTGQGMPGGGLTVLADGSHVHGRGGANTAVAGHAGLKVTVDTTDGKLQEGCNQWTVVRLTGHGGRI